MPKKVTGKDFEYIAEYVISECKRRKESRKSLDYQIKEIDRQIEMVPDVSHKMTRQGVRDPRLAWLPEVELPLQAEALETLCSDVRSMLFPDSGPWFAPHVAMTDEYLDIADFSSIVAGDEAEIPTQITQDNADKLVAGFINSIHRTYDFRGNVDLINTEALSYGVGAARGRIVTLPVIRESAQGVLRENRKIPALIPRSLKETYLDDRTHILMHEGYLVGPLTIFKRTMTLKELQIRANGNSNPESEDGGWIAANVKKLEADKFGNITFYEAEGDFVIPRKTSGDLYFPRTVFSVAEGKNGKVIRVQYLKYGFDSVLTFPYHRERVESPYATSPLRKGRPLQAAAVEALMRVVEASALNARPPVGYDSSDTWFAEQGGPNIEPGALWGTLGEINVHQIGNVSALFNVYAGFLQQYADAVGIHPARLGAQTVSHTTAYAKNAELQRGAVRTVDYARHTLQGPLTKWLTMCYEMGRKFSGKQMFYIDAYRGWVEIDRDMLPEQVVFDAHGSGGPAEAQQKQQAKLSSLQLAMQMDQVGQQQGEQPTLNLPAMIQDVLVEGGWSDTDPYLLNADRPTSAPDIPVGILQEGLGAE